MMTALVLAKLLLAYLLPGTVGYLVIDLLDQQNSMRRLYRLGAALLIGPALLTMQALVAAWIGFGVHTAIYIGILLFDILVLQMLFWRLRHKLWQPSLEWIRQAGANFKQLGKKEKIFLGIFFLLLGVKVALALWHLDSSRIFEFDAWHNWQLRAKVMFNEQRIPLDPSFDFYLGGGETSYPLHDPLWKVWLASVIGSWKENLIGTYSVVYYLIILVLFFSSLPQTVTFARRLVYTYLATGLPYLYFHASIAYADIGFTAYLLLAVSALFWFLYSSKYSFLYVSAISLGGTIVTKNEGFAVVALVLFVITVALAVRQVLPWRSWFVYWAITIATSLPWLLFRLVHRLDILSGGASSFTLVFHRELFAEWFSSVFLRSHFNFLWFLFFFILLAHAKRIWKILPLRTLTFVVLLLFGFYNGIILFTDRAQDLTALVRVNLHIAPVAALLIALVWSLAAGEPAGAKRNVTIERVEKS